MPLTNARVIIDDDAPEDVSILHMPEGPLVILRSEKWQSQENAIRQLQVVAGPAAHPDDVRALVRKHLPNALDFDLLAETTTPPLYIRSDAPPARPKRSTWVVRACMVLAGVAIGSAALTGYHLASTASEADQPVDMTHTDFFRGFTLAAGYQCSPLDLDDADCIYLETGKMSVMSARHGEFHKPDTYWFRNSDRIAVVYVFDSPELAASYAGVQSNKRLWPYLSSTGKYAVASIDAELYDRFERAVESYAAAESTNSLPTG